MAEDNTAERTIQARLIRDMARRLRYPWVMYVIFCAFFALQTGFGAAHRPAVWTFTVLMLVVGLLRMGSGERIANLEDGRVLSSSSVMLAIVALHSIFWGAFVAFTLWYGNGDPRVEIGIWIGVAGFATGGAVVLAAYPPLAWLHLLVQCAPLLVWSVFERQRVGLLMLSLVTAFVVFIGTLIMAQHKHILAMFRSQLLLEIRGEELRQAKEIAEQASSARAQFLAGISHEIRTPLHGVLGLAQVLGDTSLDKGQQELLGALSRSGGHLLTIVNDILDYSKIASGKLTLEAVPFELCTLVKDVATPAQTMAQVKGLRWLVQRSEDAVGRTYRGDPVRIRQILTNLLGNAVKFTESGEVILRIGTERPGWLTFTVTDTGIGISPHQLNDLFQDFTQADASTTRRFGGTGLGLAISKRLVELMDGTLSVESKPGEGSRFTASIPLPLVEARHCPINLPEKESPPALPLPPGLRILLAEDNLVNRMIAQRYLSGKDFTVDTADTGRIAVARHSANPYDLILMDCHMPDMDGYEATAAIRALPHAADVPIVAVTAGAFAEDRERCRSAGMNGYLAKPIRREELLHAIASALAGNLES